MGIGRMGASRAGVEAGIAHGRRLRVNLFHWLRLFHWFLWRALRAHGDRLGHEFIDQLVQAGLPAKML